MKFGVVYANTGMAVAPEGAAELGSAAEEAGFDSLWTVEHVAVPQGYGSRYPYSRSGRMAGGAEDFDIPDPLVWLAFVAAHTSTVRLCTGILILPQRNPIIVAKSVATLDVLSGGRVTLGIGAGWLAEEFDALGVPFDDRGDRTDDAIRALRILWTDDVASYEGSHHRFENLYSRPRPTQGAVPIVVGGHSKRAARRAGELGDGFFPTSADPADLPGLISLAREHAERSGRDPADLEITVGGVPDPAYVEKMAEIGVDRIVLGNLGPEAVRQAGEVVGAGSDSS